MSDVKVGLKEKSIAARLGLSRTVVTKMSANASFPTPSPSLADLGAAADALQAAQTAVEAARAGLRELTTALHARERALDELLRRESAYVQSVSGGNRTTIESAGFDVRREPSPVGPLPMVRGVRFVPTGAPGTVTLKWTALRGAASYRVEHATSATANADWHTASSPTRAKAVVTDLPSGVRLFFRVAAVGAAGVGICSEAVPQVVP